MWQKMLLTQFEPVITGQETPDTNPHVDGASEAPQVGSRHDKTAEAGSAISRAEERE
jgi:hypothetical protein